MSLRAKLLMLAIAERQHVTAVNTEFGRPFQSMDFANLCVTQSPRQDFECRPHGLRKVAGRTLAEAGCTQHEIMSALGPKSLAEVERQGVRVPLVELVQVWILQRMLEQLGSEFTQNPHREKRLAKRFASKQGPAATFVANPQHPPRKRGSWRCP
jgi:hypothetical protein